MSKKKKKLITVSEIFIHHIDRKIGESIQSELNSELASMTCSNTDCFNWKLEKEKSEYGISMFVEGQDKCSLMYSSSRWCCNEFKFNVESAAIQYLSKHFTEDQIKHRRNDFYHD